MTLCDERFRAMALDCAHWAGVWAIFSCNAPHTSHRSVLTWTGFEEGRCDRSVKARLACRGAQPSAGANDLSLTESVISETEHVDGHKRQETGKRQLQLAFVHAL